MTPTDGVKLNVPPVARSQYLILIAKGMLIVGGVRHHTFQKIVDTLIVRKADLINWSWFDNAQVIGNPHA